MEKGNGDAEGRWESLISYYVLGGFCVRRRMTNVFHYGFICALSGVRSGKVSLESVFEETNDV